MPHALWHREKLVRLCPQTRSRAYNASKTTFNNHGLLYQRLSKTPWRENAGMCPASILRGLYTTFLALLSPCIMLAPQLPRQ